MGTNGFRENSILLLYRFQFYPYKARYSRSGARPSLEGTPRVFPPSLPWGPAPDSLLSQRGGWT
eukprot:92857-Rhodomonas_salina.1